MNRESLRTDFVHSPLPTHMNLCRIRHDNLRRSPEGPDLNLGTKLVAFALTRPEPILRQLAGTLGPTRGREAGAKAVPLSQVQVCANIFAPKSNRIWTLIGGCSLM